MNTTELVVEMRPEKFQAIQDLNHDLYNTSAALYQLS